jgi:Zn-dependent peptidase ImmA (M78 family)
MEHVWQVVDRLRDQYPVLQAERLPIDIFVFMEVDLGLDPIPFDDLMAKYRVDAAIKADFSGLYLDAQQYNLMERGPIWKLQRLRFSIAHELAHYFLHRDLPQPESFASLANFAQWSSTYMGKKYTVEQEANEFAGRLLVPENRLKEFFDEFALEAVRILPDFMQSSELRNQFAERCGTRFGVNAQVIEVRLERDMIWPVG